MLTPLPVDAFSLPALHLAGLFREWKALMDCQTSKTLHTPYKRAPVSPFSFLSASTSYSDSSLVELEGNSKCLETQSHHQRCSSESFLIEEQPSWLDGLLNESETFIHRGHRRSASDSYAYLEAAETYTITDENKNKIFYVGTSTRSGNLVHYKDVDRTSIDTKTNSLDDGNTKGSEEVVCNFAVEQSREEPSPQNLDVSASRGSVSQGKPSASKAEAKRAKQHNAHRSHVRKLQYIAHLEKTVQILQTEGSEASAELEFLEQQNMILTMENRALRQRLESILQEQIIKQWEQEMLEREIARLHNLNHAQKQQKMQLHNQQQQHQSHHHHARHRRNRSRDLDQVNGFQTKNNDVSSNKG